MGFPNQIENRSIFRPRHRAARKCPSSCTKMRILNSTSTSIWMKMIFRICISPVYRHRDGQLEYSRGRGHGNRRVITLLKGSALPNSKPPSSKEAPSLKLQIGGCLRKGSAVGHCQLEPALGAWPLELS